MSISSIAGVLGLDGMAICGLLGSNGVQAVGINGECVVPGEYISRFLRDY